MVSRVHNLQCKKPQCLQMDKTAQVNILFYLYAWLSPEIGCS